MNHLSESEDTRLELEYRLRGVGKRQESYYLPEFLRNAELLKPGHTWVFRLLQIILAAAVLLAVIFRTFPFFIFLAFSAGTNFITYMVMKQKYDILLSASRHSHYNYSLFGMDTPKNDSNKQFCPFPPNNQARSYQGTL